MTHGWADVFLAVAPIRAEPDGASEQISQSIMGDAVQVLDGKSGYRRVRGRDRYEGWILESQLHLCDEADLFLQADRPEFPTVWIVQIPFAELRDASGDLLTRVALQTPVRVDVTTVGNGGPVLAILANGMRGLIDAAAIGEPVLSPPDPVRLCAIARCLLGTPYLWGGTTPFGFDCSGLVQRIYSLEGVDLPRDAYLQAECSLGRLLPDSEPLIAGDLVFFRGASDRECRGITHVGMMLDSDRVIHSCGRAGVTVDPLDGAANLAAYSRRGAWRLEPRPTE